MVPLGLLWRILAGLIRGVVGVAAKPPIPAVNAAAFTVLVGTPVVLTDFETMKLTGLAGKIASGLFIIVVLVLGVSGYGTAEELVLLERFGFRFEPDVVIVGRYRNDPMDDVRSDLYRLTKRGELVRAAAEYLPTIDLRNKLYSFCIYRWSAENLHLG